MTAVDYRVHGSMMLMPGVSLDRRRGERKHDQENRRSIHSQSLGIHEHGSLDWQTRNDIAPYLILG